jgi:membrane protease YdiL (CAAX protease family)
MLSQRLAKILTNRFGYFRAGWRILFYLLSAIVLHKLLGLFAGSLLMTQGEPLSDYSLLLNRFVSKSVKFVSVLLPALVLLKWVDRRPVALLGLGFYKGAVRELLAGMAMGFVLTVASVFILRVTGLASFSFNGFSMSALQYVLGVLVVLVISSCYEEVLFRGYVFQSLIEGTSFLIALAIYSLLFGAAHIGNSEATVYTVAFAVIAGMFLGTVYYKTRALWMCIGIHFMWNWTMGPLFGMGISGSKFLRRSLFTYEPSESSLIHGVDAMSEIIPASILVALTIYLWRARWVKPAEYNRRLWEPYLPDSKLEPVGSRYSDEGQAPC